MSPRLILPAVMLASISFVSVGVYASDKKNIPQQAVPVGINLWCFRQTPATTQSVIIRSFEFAPK